MKKIFHKGIAAIACAGMLAGCSSDYLDVQPETVISTSQIHTTQEGAQQALYGLCESMYFPMDDYFDSYLFPNGEPYISTVYGEVLGQDYFSYMWASRSGTNFSWASNMLPGGWIPLLPWSYFYNLVNQANVILDGIDDIDGDENQLKLIKAQALTIRAHAYDRLVQFYAPRWQDSENGSRYCVVLRLKAGVEDVPLSTMNDVLAQVYKDCDDAIALYSESTAKRAKSWEPGIEVAYGIKARAALLREDWPTAQENANKARAGYSIMTPEEFNAGFCSPTREWMWYAYGGDFGYACFGTMYACNGAYPGVWGDGAGAINYELYRQFPAGDIRSEQFFTPDKLLGTTVKASAFWSSTYCDPVSMNLNSLHDLMKAQIRAYQNSHMPTDTSIDWPLPYNNFQTGNSNDTKVVFGAQYKFWAKNDYGVGDYCMMRASEMLLTEAEAACHNGDDATAVAALLELNAQRNPNYTCSLSGDALLDEVRLQRRFELWGEGFSVFDLKRWNMPMVRNPWERNNVNSNNIPVAYQLRIEPNARTWKFAVPLNESRYNKLVDRTLVDY
ncbi:MAG: RagB/SusD family nutrient uptake outer membrane protein [Muribaculaceae bacterium]|nr:RagB/SusD family nutrient uptake outer membrane protein [Muribaculaceae bacterium]MDE7080769.1 RagB/SusD family nutrient uptake outer membrane protein [Muribaculaceae bacterium]